MSKSLGSHRLVAVLALFLGFAILVPMVQADGPASPGASDPLAVPNGTPEELLAFIKQLQRPKRESGTRAERMAKRQQTAAAIVAAADKILESAADDTVVADALAAEFDTLPLLGRLGDKNANEKISALVEKYANDPRAAIAQAVKLRELARRFDEMERAADLNDTEALKELVAAVKENLSAGEVNEAKAGLVIRAVQLIRKARATDLAAEALPEMATMLMKADDPKSVALGAQLAKLAADQLAQDGRSKEAIAAYLELAATLKEKNHPQLAAIAEQSEGAAHQLDMVGHPLDIQGKLVDHNEFDWSGYRGKVVLVDFWATWCGPCLAELPNVKATYEKYHEQGFDVVGISLDQDRAALETFLEKEKLAWPILFSDDPNATGWKHPLATKYGVNSIPRAILVDQEGNVVTLSARGDALSEMVGRLLEK